MKKGSDVCVAFSETFSALRPRMWWSSSTQAWGTWSTSGRTTRSQSQVKQTALRHVNQSNVLILEGEHCASASTFITRWCMTVSPTVMNLAGKAYFDAVSKIGENAAVSPVSRDLGESIVTGGYILSGRLWRDASSFLYEHSFLWWYSPLKIDDVTPSN